MYRPYKQKKRTRATIAKEKGLEPLAKLIISQTVKDGNKDEIVTKYINKRKRIRNSRRMYKWSFRYHCRRYIR